VARHLRLRHDCDAAGVGIGDQPLQLVDLVDPPRGAAVRGDVLRAELQVLSRGEGPALVVGQVQLKVTGPVKPAELHHLIERGDGVILARHIEHDAAEVGVRSVLDGDSGQPHVTVRRAEQLKERRAALGRRPGVEAADDRLPVDGDGVGAVGGARRLAFARDQDRLIGADLPVDARHDATRPPECRVLRSPRPNGAIQSVQPAEVRLADARFQSEW
jgi:hypothetical protein